jgi:exo-beta-1,3-glucanase (GH17 family)
MDSIFKKKHHRRRSSSVLGWNSDDDEVMDRTTVTPSEHPSSSSSGSSQERAMRSEKSTWLQKEHCKQKQVKNCLCVGVVACFIVLGAILAFTFKEQWTRADGSSAVAIRPKTGPQAGKGGLIPGANPRELLHHTIESMFHVNTTIIPDPNLRKVFYGIDYTPRGSQEPDCKVNLGNVIEDIKILSQLTDRIRLYGMACRQTEDVMKALQYLDLPDMQVILTLWVDNNKASWEKQSRLFWNLIDNNLVMDASTYTSDMLHEQAARSADTITISKVASRIIGISVGNEVLFRNEDPSKKNEHVPLETLEAYMQEIRRGLRDRAASAASSPNPTYSALGQQLAQIPIFSSDLGRNAHQIVDKEDWVLSNIHPFFAYTSANQAADWAFANFRDETLKAAGRKPAMISEVGWPSGPSSAALGKRFPFFVYLFCDLWVDVLDRRQSTDRNMSRNGASPSLQLYPNPNGTAPFPLYPPYLGTLLALD